MEPIKVTLTDIDWLCDLALDDVGSHRPEDAKEEADKIRRIKRELKRAVRAIVYGQPS